MFTLKVRNKYDEELEISNNPAYSIVSVDGIDPPESTINTTHNAGADGSVFNSAFINERTITITLAINYPAEANRLNLYRYFKSKFPVRLFYKNKRRDVYIDGYVQSFQIAYFDQKQTAQIVIYCPLPMFNNVNDNIQDFSNIEPMFEFPFDIDEPGIEFSVIIPNNEKSIINKGDMDTGVIISIKAVGSVITPKIYNVDANESMILNVSMISGDEIIIDTRQGHKSIKMISGDTTTNIIGTLDHASSWFVLKPGDNVFTLDADALPENMIVVFTVIDQFEGV